MKKIQTNQSREFRDEFDPDLDSIDTDTEIKGKIIKVHNKNVENDITSDVILAKFESVKDKVYILELATIADDSLNLLNRYYSWLDGYFKKMYGYYPESYELSKQMRFNRLKNIFMKRIDWLCNLNRNSANNYLIKTILNSVEPDITDDKDNKMSKELLEIKKELANHEKKPE